MEKRNRTHGRHERMCGEVVDTSGSLTKMNLTGSVRELVHIPQYRSMISATDLGIREALGEHRLVVIVRGRKQPGGGNPPCRSRSFKYPAQAAIHSQDEYS